MIDILIIYLITLIIKIAAFLVSGYTAVLADAAHSVVDIAMILVLMISAKLSAKAADHSHPMGHELAKNVASLVIAVSFITLLSFELGKKGIEKILNPTYTYTNTELVILAEIVVLLLLFVAAFVSWRREGILNKTLLFESVNDSLSTVAAVVGVVLTWYGATIFDGVATVVIAILIAYNSIRLFKENARFLLGLSPPDEFYDRVESVCMDVDGVEGVHDMLGVFVGEQAIHLDLHITVNGSMSIDDADKLSEKIIEELKAKIPEIKHVTVHFCPHTGRKRKIIR